MALQLADGSLDYRVDGLLGMGVLPVRALGDPFHDVEAHGHVQADRVTVHDIGNQGAIPVGGELVSDELRVLPNAKHVRDVDYSGVLVLLISGRDGQIPIPLPSDLDHLPGRLTPGKQN